MPESSVDFEYMRPGAEDIMHIFSCYNKTSADEGRIKDILFLFDTVPIGLWICLFCSFLTFIAVFRFGYRLIDRKSKSDATWITTSAFLDQDNFPTNRRYMMIISLFMSVGLFFAMNYLTNSVGTDLVVIPSPTVVRTYDDILSRNITGNIKLTENNNEI